MSSPSRARQRHPTRPESAHRASGSAQAPFEPLQHRLCARLGDLCPPGHLVQDRACLCDHQLGSDEPISAQAREAHGCMTGGTATDASRTRTSVNVRYASDAAQQPSCAQGCHRRRSATHPAARTSGAARPQSRVDRDHRPRAWRRRVVSASAQNGATGEPSPGSCPADRQLQRRSTCQGWYVGSRTQDSTCTSPRIIPRCPLPPATAAALPR